MPKNAKSGATVLAALSLLAIGFAVGCRGLYIWIRCGYDCAALQLVDLSATAAMLLGVVLGGVGVGLLLGRLFEHGR